MEGLEYDRNTVQSMRVGCLAVALAPVAVLVGWWADGWAAGGIWAAVVVSLVFVVDNMARDGRIPEEARQAADRATEFARQVRPGADPARVSLVRIDAGEFVYAVYYGPYGERVGVAISRSEAGTVREVPLRTGSDVLIAWARRWAERRRPGPRGKGRADHARTGDGSSGPTVAFGGGRSPAGDESQ